VRDFRCSIQTSVSYGYFFDWSRPRDLQSGAGPLTEWVEIRSREVAYFSTDTIGAGQLSFPRVKGAGD
jgi:hypothetical protein